MSQPNDPVDERLRSYYQSIQGPAPASLEARVARSLDADVAPRPAWWSGRRPLASGAAIVAVAALVAGFAFRGLGPAPAGPTATPAGSTSGTPTARPTPIIVFVTPTPAATAAASPAATPAATPAVPSPLPTPTPTIHGIFLARGSMSVARDRPTATLLADGRVLVAGGLVSNGVVSSPTASAEIYDPDTGKFSPTGSMTAARWPHTATLLADGRVLMVGGADMADGYGNLKSAEIYDPATGKFTATGSMAAGRSGHTATLLEDGRVLVAGGANSIGLNSAEIYDPASGTFTETGSMTVARQEHAAALLSDGRVLLVGGTSYGKVGPFGALASAELYDPATGRFTATGSMARGWASPVAARLADGRVLVLAGQTARLTDGGTVGGKATPFAPAAVYEPGTGRFSVADANGPSFSWAATTLADGRVLAIADDSQTARLFNPATGHFSDAGKAGRPIGCQTATLLQDGEVLLLGSPQFIGDGAAATLYQP
jgi:hypothetical protein